VRAYGLRYVEAGLKVTTDTQFLIGSITKSFTATGLALLMDERRLDWKKPVRDYIPEFRLHDAVATDRITVRDLLCHHSGLPRHDWIWVPGVGQDSDGQLTLTAGSQPTCKLRPYQGRTFIDELERFQVEFHLGPDGEVDELIFHQPNATLVARRALARNVDP
jgi:hypothetical protein